ncbi:PP2C family serine/threonine-protein phosphatase [uncultured Clostridium sp.]|jgi:protein phosphatase|uniref:PP2C family protein-serine/threonine phosphatase n=1 Tax=uncultured Clostridium sp. TaxID=59620 RepID=UPI002625B017|nr:PP2C family serine/threonine-protein phosphatase [uncultured Clostridium sp.]
MEGNRFEVGALSEAGLVKPNNEDNILVQVGEYKNNDFGLFVVCDGLGGLAYGEIASAMVINKFRKWWNEKVVRIVLAKHDSSVIESLKQVVYEANQDIINYSNRIKKRIGTTVSALLVLKERYYIVHVGDSRIYKISGGIEQLTEDHSYVANEVKCKRMTIEEARVSNQSNLLLQCVGVKEDINIFSKCGERRERDIFLVCSDGFYGTLSNRYIQQIINRWKYSLHRKDINEVMNSMVDEVKRNKERDNISIILTTSALKQKNMEKDTSRL